MDNMKYEHVQPKLIKLADSDAMEAALLEISRDSHLKAGLYRVIESKLAGQTLTAEKAVDTLAQAVCEHTNGIHPAHAMAIWSLFPDFVMALAITSVDALELNKYIRKFITEGYKKSK